MPEPPIPHRPRILHLIGSNGVGGPEKQILHHAVDMQGSSFELAIGSFRDLAEPPEILIEAEARGLRTLCLPPGMHPRLVAQLADALHTHKISLLCTHGFKANVLGYLVSRRSSVPHVAFLRGWTAETARVRLYERLERQALARAQTVVCVSPRQAVQVARLRGRRPAPVVIENAMLPPFARHGLPPAPSRSTLGIEDSAFVFGSVGRLSAEKGHRFLIEAFAHLVSDPTLPRPVHLLVVGDGREQTALEQQAGELGIRGKVYFAGFQGNPGQWMAHMDCMVQPSLTEGTPNSVLEAFCLNLPVIATAVGGVPYLITDRSNGLLVPPSNPQALRDAINELLRDPNLGASLAANAASARPEYSTRHQRESLETLYKQLLPSSL